MKKRAKKQKVASTVDLRQLLSQAEEYAKKAKRNGQSLSGSGFYASKFDNAKAECTLELRKIRSRLSAIEDKESKDALKGLREYLDTFFDPKMSNADRGNARRQLNFIYKTAIHPVLSGPVTHIPSDDLFPLGIVEGTRGYIISVAKQACGTYDQGWYDASAVMCRRLLETLIIETFESYSIAEKIKKEDRTFHHLRHLIDLFLKEQSWNVSRSVAKALPKLKDLGDQSAHNRRYIAKKSDLDSAKRDLRLTLEELVHLSNLKR